jgi:hypothetical protein
MEIIKQQEFTFEGTGCLIKDVVIMLYVHETYIVELIRKYYGWGGDELKHVYTKELKSREAAEKHYQWIIDGEK